MLKFAELVELFNDEFRAPITLTSGSLEIFEIIAVDPDEQATIRFEEKYAVGDGGIIVAIIELADTFHTCAKILKIRLKVIIFIG